MIEILLGPSIQLHILGCSHIKQAPGPEKYRLIYQYNLNMLSFLWSNSKSMCFTEETTILRNSEFLRFFSF